MKSQKYSIKKKSTHFISGIRRIVFVGFFLFLLTSCAPELMKVTTTKNGASVSTIMPYDQTYKSSLKDSMNVEVEKIKK